MLCMSFDTEASLFPSFTRAMTSLSVGTIVECLVGRVAFSNGCKKLPVCCFRVMVALFSSHKLLFRCLDCFETWVTSADVCCASEHKDEIPKPSYAYAIRKHKPPCVSHGIIKVQKVTSQVLFSWNATARIKTVQFHISSPEHVAFDLACCWKLSVFSTDHKESQFSSPCK